MFFRPLETCIIRVCQASKTVAGLTTGTRLSFHSLGRVVFGASCPDSPSITVVRLIVKFPLTNQNRQKVVEEK